MMKNDNSTKLIISSYTCNVLVTHSCTIEENPQICIGPSTTTFTSSNKTRVVCNEKSIAKALKMLENTNGTQLYPYDQMEQIKQVRSKETYHKCRYASDFTKDHIYQPCTIWTLIHTFTTKTEVSQSKKASELFNRIAIEVHTSLKSDENPTLKKEALGWFDGKSGDIASEVKAIEEMFGDSEEITILGNEKLDQHLKQLANLLASSIHTANDVVKGRLAQRLLD